MTYNLNEKETIKFLNKMYETENSEPTEYQKKMIKEIKSNRNKFEVIE